MATDNFYINKCLKEVMAFEDPLFVEKWERKLHEVFDSSSGVTNKECYCHVSCENGFFGGKCDQSIKTTSNNKAYACHLTIVNNQEFSKTLENYVSSKKILVEKA